MKIFLDTIGCRLNQAEIEKFAVQFRAAGYDLVSTSMEADLVIVNTCAVTSEAGSDSRQHIRQAARFGKAEIIATGCLSTLEGEKLCKLPGVIMNVPNSGKDHLVADALHLKNQKDKFLASKRQPIPGRRGRTRAFIKAQDGCNNHCTFCITRLVRGKSRSISASEVLVDITGAMEGGAKEIILSGVQLGAWGAELDPPGKLSNLVQLILAKTSIPRIRLSSVEPWDLDEDFFQLWKNPRICRQLHIPLQSGSDKVLKAMGRKNTANAYMKLVELARSICPEIAVTTDILVGFPDESEGEYQETLNFIQKIHFANGHVFSFSPRPGTGAEKLPFQIPTEIKKRRNREIRDLLSYLSMDYRRNFLDKKMQVLWERSQYLEDGRFLLQGWTDNYIKVTALFKRDLHNEISSVRLMEHNLDRMFGEVLMK